MNGTIDSAPSARGISGYTDPLCLVQNIPILKNASTYIATESKSFAWQNQFVEYSKMISRFVLLRDPFERYVSGLTEYFDRYIFQNPDSKRLFKKLFNEQCFDLYLDLLFDQKHFKFDNHTALQIDSLSDIIAEVSKDNITFIKISNNLGDDLNFFFTKTKLLLQFY